MICIFQYCAEYWIYAEIVGFPAGSAGGTGEPRRSREYRGRPGIGWPCHREGTTSAVGGRDRSRPERLRPTPEVLINRLVLWNIDLTLVDVGRITREAYAEAFRRVTGRPVRQLPQLPGRGE